MLKFYHAPWSRSFTVFWLLEELGVDYDMEIVDIRGEGGAPEAYRAIQPNKKVPAVEHDGVIITERAAITIHLTEAFSETGLAPASGEAARAPFLTWVVYCDSVFDPCVAARAHGLEYQSNDYSFGLFEDMVRHLERHLGAHDFAAGDRFTAADVQLGSAMAFTMDVLKVLPERPPFREYVDRVTNRPAYQRVQERDRDMAMANPVLRAQFAGFPGGLSTASRAGGYR